LHKIVPVKLEQIAVLELTSTPAGLCKNRAVSAVLARLRLVCPWCTFKMDVLGSSEMLVRIYRINGITVIIMVIITANNIGQRRLLNALVEPRKAT
jgi:hypothetical protein